MLNLNTQRSTRLDILEIILWPLVKFCVRSATSVHEVVVVIKKLYLRAATEEMQRSGRKVNCSRLSVATGLHRAEIMKLNELPRVPPEHEAVGLASKVVGKWRHDKRFINKSKLPRVLSYKTADSEFNRLVSSISTAIHPGTVMAELERTGVIEVTPRGLRLVTQATALGGDLHKSSQLLAKDLDTLISSVGENFRDYDRLGNLHIRTEYDNVYVKDMGKVRRWLIEEGKTFHRKIREFLTSHDKDLSPSSNPEAKAGGKVVVTSFSLTEPNPNAD
ncbi:MAG: hypothetical protein DCC75_01520 [Proteobacteria bacterium]|nr:MAG: hypothetical protein DCC75_01520 [Pseudomonadota bacterium]